MKMLVTLIAVFLLLPLPAEACTGITLTGEDGTVVRSRTLEWGAFDVHPRLDIVPRGHQFKSEPMPDGKPGLSWKNKYGFVGISVVGKLAFNDGINEKGLSAGMFYLPGFTQYQDYNPKKAANSMAPSDLLGYVLGQCKTVDEAVKAVKAIEVMPVVEESLGFPAPLHFVVTDPSGKSVVVQFIDKKLTVFDAPLGVITNSPNYDWHMTNLRNYINMSAVGLPTKTVEDLDFAPLGAGSGMIGLPGDFTPPSRFVRAVAFSQSARKTRGKYDTVRETFRILDNFNVPAAAAEGVDGSHEGDEGLLSATQITTAADTKNLVFYYHTQYNRRVRKIDLKKIDFSKIGTNIISKPTDPDRAEDALDITLQLR